MVIILKSKKYMGNVKKINENVNEFVNIQEEYVSDCFHSLIRQNWIRKECGI